MGLFLLAVVEVMLDALTTAAIELRDTEASMVETVACIDRDQPR